MPKSRVVIYREPDGSAPFVDWFRALSSHAKGKDLVRIERLRELGHELRCRRQSGSTNAILNTQIARRVSR
jgi:hypothetical protein